jgi:kynurenine 3-monooxygenase
MKAPIVIIGGGMGGSLMAIVLAQKNYIVDLYEERPDIRDIPPRSNRSINQSLSIRGLNVLEKIGIWSSLQKLTLVEKGRTVHPLDGCTFFSPYGRDEKEVHYSFNRNVFNGALLDHASTYPNIRLHFNMRCTDIHKRTVTFENTKTHQKLIKEAQVVIGADGVHSIARTILEQKGITTSERIYLEWGYKSLYIPACQATSLANETFHIWPREDCALLAIPNRDGSFVFTIVLPLKGAKSFSGLKTKQAILSFFETNFPDVAGLAPLFTENFEKNRLGHFESVYTSRWHDEDSLVLLGDACHAPTIFYSQGVSATFEDCLTLAECIETYGPNWKRVFTCYQEQRKRHTDVLADLCVQRFYELKDGFRSKKFLAREATESALSRLFPFFWKPLYTLMTHTSIPYADAYRRYQTQQRIAKLLGLELIVSLYALLMKEEGN